jgi:hypothetical protein
MNTTKLHKTTSKRPVLDWFLGLGTLSYGCGWSCTGQLGVIFDEKNDG